MSLVLGVTKLHHRNQNKTNLVHVGLPDYTEHRIKNTTRTLDPLGGVTYSDNYQIRNRTESVKTRQQRVLL